MNVTHEKGTANRADADAAACLRIRRNCKDQAGNGAKEPHTLTEIGPNAIIPLFVNNAMSGDFSMSNEQLLIGASKSLISWFQEHGRDLPWREGKHPYAVWISEVMLQQTRIEAVKGYYQRFMQALPDVSSLSACEEEVLLKLWEGLGYYNRARNLKKAAMIIEEEYGGQFPKEYAHLIKLPGFGPYTAGAVASICFNEAVPAIDGNVLRVLSRIWNDDTDVLSNAAKKRAQESITSVLSDAEPSLFNQAIMELGEVICVPNGEPRCSECPISQMCLAYAAGRQRDLPVRIKKTKRKIEHRTLIILRDTEGVVIQKRPPRGLLAGMYELPYLEGEASMDAVLSFLRSEGFSPLHIRPLPPAKHLFSHVEWRMNAYLVMAEDFEEYHQKLPKNYVIAHIDDLQQKYPIPGAFAAYADWMNIKIGADRFSNGEIT